MIINIVAPKISGQLIIYSRMILLSRLKNDLLSPFRDIPKVYVVRTPYIAQSDKKYQALEQNELIINKKLWEKKHKTLCFFPGF